MVTASGRVVLAALLWVPVTVGCATATAPYLGQKVPGEMPAVFAPGMVSTAAVELNGVVSPDGRELLFTRIVDGVFTIHSSRLDGGSWSAPRPLHLMPQPGGEVDMAFAPDGSSLYFLGSEGEAAGGGRGFDIWVSARRDGGWSEAVRVPAPVSTEAAEFYPCVVADGSLYFTSDRPGGRGESDLYRAQRRPDGSFAEPVNLGPPVNSPGREGDAFVAPDESYVVFTARRPDGRGQGDLYVSFRTADGGWGEPRPLGAEVNTAATEFCPMVTPDGRYLFFSRRDGDTWAETTAGDLLWVDAGILDRLRPAAAASR